MCLNIPFLVMSVFLLNESTCPVGMVPLNSTHYIIHNGGLNPTHAMFGEGMIEVGSNVEMAGQTFILTKDTRAVARIIAYGVTNVTMRDCSIESGGAHAASFLKVDESGMKGGGGSHLAQSPKSVSIWQKLWN
jgi:hypothetical protein